MIHQHEHVLRSSHGGVAHNSYISLPAAAATSACMTHCLLYAYKHAELQYLDLNMHAQTRTLLAGCAGTFTVACAEGRPCNTCSVRTSVTIPLKAQVTAFGT